MLLHLSVGQSPPKHLPICVLASTEADTTIDVVAAKEENKNNNNNRMPLHGSGVLLRKELVLWFFLHLDNGIQTCSFVKDLHLVQVGVGVLVTVLLLCRWRPR